MLLLQVLDNVARHEARRLRSMVAKVLPYIPCQLYGTTPVLATPAADPRPGLDDAAWQWAAEGG